MTRAEEQALKAYPNIKIGEQELDQSSVRDVYMQGYEQAKNDLMEDSVEAVVIKPDYEVKGIVKSIRFQIDSDIVSALYNKGDKVKVIIVKE